MLRMDGRGIRSHTPYKFSLHRPEYQSYRGISRQVPEAALSMSARLVAISMYSPFAQRSANER